MKKRKTAAEIGKDPVKEGSLGERVWKPTSEVKLKPPLVAASGKHRRERILWMRGEKCIVRPYKVPRDPKSDSQVTKRTYMGRARGSWSKLAPAQRAGWQRFALEHVFTPEEMSTRALSLAGFNAFVRAQIYRQGMGLDLEYAPPTHPMPGVIRDIQELPPPDAASFAFRLSHGEKALEGRSVLFELTPALPTARRKPRPKDPKWAGETDPESFLPLAPDGAVYLLERAKFSIDPGRRYAVRARILSPDGLPGPDLMTVLVRLAADPGAWQE